MSSKFEMSDLGKLKYYLGIEVMQTEKGIAINQQSYAMKILKETGMIESNPVYIPMDPGLKLSKAETEEEINPTEYRKVIGCLRYLMHTRPDMAFSVGVLSRYMESPRVSHGKALKHVLRYLKGTTDYGINYGDNNPRQIIGYSDSSYNIDEDDGRSTTGYMFYYGKSPLTWCSQKQATVALSSCEAEFMAATAASCQAIWLQDLLEEVTGWNKEKVVIRVDNKSAIALAKNPVFHKKSKHIKARFYFIRECVDNEQIDVEYVPGDVQLADVLTKPLPKTKFIEMRRLIGMEELPKSNSELGGSLLG